MAGMKTVVAYSWARDPEDAAVRADGSVDWRGARMVPGEDDAAAVALAREVTVGGRLVGLTLGDGDASWALPRGADEVVAVTDAPSLADDAATAELMAGAIRWIGEVDLVVIGDTDNHPGVAAALPALLGWPGLLGVCAARVDNGRVEVSRRLDDRDQVLTMPLPAVVGVAAAAAEKQPPGMKEVLAARRRPITSISVADLGAHTRAPWESRGTQPVSGGQARVFDGAPSAAARELVAALRADGVL
jgi:electron transfer flavoprotein beta subunit